MRAYSAHLGYLFTDLPLADRLAAAACAGFSFVEHPNPYAMPADRMSELCEANALTLAQIALPAGDPERGEKGLAGLPGREAEFCGSVMTGLSYARAAGSRFVHVMAGVRPAGVDAGLLWRTYIGNLRHACAEAERIGMTVLVEPIGVATIADYILDTPQLALKAIADTGAPNLAILFDAFHAKNAGICPVTFVHEAPRGSIAHIHIADHPGRHEPGTGTLDFQAFFDALDEIGYAGAIGLEYIPLANTLSGLGWRDAYR